MYGFDPNDYDLKVELAQHSNGIATVYVAQYLPNDKYVVVKRYDLEKTSKEEAVAIRDDILKMRAFDHPNIHSYHVSFSDGYYLNVVSPLMCFGSCKDMINKFFVLGLPEILVALFMKDVLNGLVYMHNSGFVHRSIRASHILVSKQKAVLTGFHECTSFEEHGKRARALHELAPCSIKSLNWLAPEVLEQNMVGYTEKSDVYSIGITCCEMANGFDHFADVQRTFMLTEKIRGNVPRLLDRSTCRSTEEVDTYNDDAGTSQSPLSSRTQEIYKRREFTKHFHQLTKICLEKNPENRWTASRLLKHYFFKQCSHTSISDTLQKYGIEAPDYSKTVEKPVPLNDSEEGISKEEEIEWDL